MVKRNYIFDTIKSVFKKYGFQPIETPAMENIETLTGKYGDEGDQLLFKVLNSRPQDAKEEKKAEMLEVFKQSLAKSTNSPVITERALKYDLTVPFARFVVQHKNDITFPFKRYQITTSMGGQTGHKKVVTGSSTSVMRMLLEVILY